MPESVKITPPGLIELLARRIAGDVTGDDLVGWAVRALTEGFDSHSLRTLAGLSPPCWLSDAEPYFSRALEELHITVPDEEGILRAYAKGVAGKILSGELSPNAGTNLIHSKVLSPLNHPEDLSPWCFLWEGSHPETFETLTAEALDEEIKKLAADFLTRA